jgi:hypothetical protein
MPKEETVKRFDVKTCMMQEKNGEYVPYADYEALELKYKALTTPPEDKNFNFSPYPELNAVAKEIAKDVAKQINAKVQRVKSETPYKAQYVLEELIKILQEAV